VLENEKEGYDGFVDASGSIAAINMTTRQALRPVSRVCDRGAGGSDGARLAGANFIIFRLAQETRGLVLSMNLNYVFVNSEFERKAFFGSW